MPGFAEFIDSYTSFFTFLATSGYEVLSFDQRGAGKTSEKKKHWGSTNEKLVFADLEKFIELQIEAHKDDTSPKQWFLIGHSMV